MSKITLVVLLAGNVRIEIPICQTFLTDLLISLIMSACYNKEMPF